MPQYPTQGVWNTPKTNWCAGDVFSLAPDYLRIYGNVLAMDAQLASLRAQPREEVLSCPQEGDGAQAEFFSAVETVTSHMAQQSGFAFDAVQYQPFAPVWTSQRLNEIEAALGEAHDRLTGRLAGRRRLALRLGGAKGAV